MKKTLYVFTWACISLLALPAAAQVPGYVPTDGLVGWWPFNGNANDESGNGNDGVVNGATLAADRNGMSNAAYSFDGASSVINVPSSQSLNIADSITISAWLLRANPQNNDGEGIFGPSNFLPDSPGFYLRIINQKADLGISSPYTEGFSNQSILGENWYHLVAIYDNSTITIYINGILDNISQVGPGNLDQWTSSGDLTIGKEAYEGAPEIYHQFNGSLDDIAIYNRALTEQEIQALYAGEPVSPPVACNPLPSNLQQGLVGYWPFCGNANDESGNGNDGTVNGATLTEDRFGNAGNAYSFLGNENILGDCSNFPSDNNSRSISIWYNANDIETNATQLWGYGGSDCGRSFIMNFNNYDVPNGNYEVQGHCVNFRNYASTPLPFNNTWHNIVLTYDGLAFRFYNDGLLVNTSSEVFLETFVSNKIFCFGKEVYTDGLTPYNDPQWPGFSGSLDDIGIWNRALTPEEVQELYTLDACTFTVYDTLTVYETVFDTLYTYETIYDTVTTYVTVTDTLLIDITFVGFEGQPSWLNTVTVFPNPASDHITIDYGNFALMAGYNTIITDAAGATVYSSAVNSQQVEIDINAWGATGVYYMSVYDASGELVAVRHIVLE